MMISPVRRFSVTWAGYSTASSATPSGAFTIAMRPRDCAFGFRGGGFVASGFEPGSGVFAKVSRSLEDHLPWGDHPALLPGGNVGAADAEEAAEGGLAHIAPPLPHQGRPSIAEPCTPHIVIVPLSCQNHARKLLTVYGSCGIVMWGLVKEAHGMAIREAELTGADIRAERNRQTPIVTQEELAKGLDPPIYTQTVGLIEGGEIEVTQGQLQAMMEAIRRVVAEREQAQ